MARLRRCLGYQGHRCGALVTGTRCAPCQRQAKPSAHARGYDADHQHQRSELALTLPAYCWYGCGHVLTADDDWVAAHVIDRDPTSPRVVSCRSCNERAKRR